MLTVACLFTACLFIATELSRSLNAVVYLQSSSGTFLDIPAPMDRILSTTDRTCMNTFLTTNIVAKVATFWNQSIRQIRPKHSIWAFLFTLRVTSDNNSFAYNSTHTGGMLHIKNRERLEKKKTYSVKYSLKVHT